MKFVKVIQDFVRGSKVPGLYVGKKIGDKRLRGEVISFNGYNMVMEIVSLDDKYYDEYLDSGGIYPLFRHQHMHKDLLIWEVQPTSMKRRVSPLLLMWEKGIGWRWSLK